MTINHASILPSDIHVPYSFLFNDSTARTTATGLVSGDVGKLARQLDDNTLWMLTATDPVAWQAIGAGGTGDTIFAADVVFETNGTLDATTVQGALLELENEKAFRSHTHHISSIESDPGVTLIDLLADKVDTSLVGAANGIATLAADGKLVVTQLPAISITDTFLVNGEAEMLALTAQTGDVAIRTDLSKSFILKGDTATNLTHWEWLQSPTDAVANDIPYTPTGDLTASNLQGAIDELEANKISSNEKGALGGVATLDPVTGYVVEMPPIEVVSDAGEVTFTPATGADWTTAPTFVSQALDELAARKAEEITYDNPVGGDPLLGDSTTITEALQALASAIPENAEELVYTNPSGGDALLDSATTVTEALQALAAAIPENAEELAYTNPSGGDALLDSATTVTEALQALAAAIPENAAELDYTPTTPSLWNTAPATTSEAIDRIAALLIAHLGTGQTIP